MRLPIPCILSIVRHFRKHCVLEFRSVCSCKRCGSTYLMTCWRFLLHRDMTLRRWTVKDPLNSTRLHTWGSDALERLELLSLVRDCTNTRSAVYDTTRIAGPLTPVFYVAHLSMPYACEKSSLGLVRFWICSEETLKEIKCTKCKGIRPQQLKGRR